MSAPSYEACKAQIMRFATRVNMRLRAAGARGYELQDIVQECAIAYVVAAEHWNPESGVPFRAYLARGMQNHVNRWANKEIGQCLGASVSLDAPAGGDDEEMDLHGALGASQPTPEEMCVKKATREKVMAKLSPRAWLFVQLYESPPAFLVEEHAALLAKAASAREAGRAVFVTNSLSAATVFDFMAASRQERVDIRRELLALSRKVSQC